MTNVSDRLIRLSIRLDGLPVQALRWRDLIAERKWSAREGVLEITFQPYDIVWLEPTV
jgi:hypothetical protein